MRETCKLYSILSYMSAIYGERAVTVNIPLSLILEEFFFLVVGLFPLFSQHRLL